MVGQCGSLGETCCSRGVLNVDGVMRIQLGRDHGQAFRADRLGTLEQVGPRLLPDDDDVVQGWALRPCPLDHRRIVRALERLGHDDHRDAGLAQHVGHLVRAVCRVDVDEDRPHLGGGELGEGPLRTVRGPDADPVALLQAQVDQPTGQPVDLGAQLGIRHPQPLGPVHQRLAVGEPRHRRIEVRPDGLLQQRGLEGPHGVRERWVRSGARHRRPSGVGPTTPANTAWGVVATRGVVDLLRNGSDGRAGRAPR